MAKSMDDLQRQTMSKDNVHRAEAKARSMLTAMMLNELRLAAGLTQKELAARLGIKQPSLSKLEGQSDMQITTLRRIVHALGGELDIRAKLKDRTISLNQFESNPDPSSRKHGRAASLRSAG